MIAKHFTFLIRCGGSIKSVKITSLYMEYGRKNAHNLFVLLFLKSKKYLTRRGRSMKKMKCYLLNYCCKKVWFLDKASTPELRDVTILSLHLLWLSDTYVHSCCFLSETNSMSIKWLQYRMWMSFIYFFYLTLHWSYLWFKKRTYIANFESTN